VNAHLVHALTGYLPHILPEAILAVAACVLFLGGTWHSCRSVWGWTALVGVVLAGLAVWYVAVNVPTIEDQQTSVLETVRAERTAPPEARTAASEASQARLSDLFATVYSSPLILTRLALFVKMLTLVGVGILVLASWHDMPEALAGEYHGCLLLIAAGTSLIGSANDLITLFLALELVSIPTYILLYLPRTDADAQEAAMKYFLLSIFSSGLLLFGFSYLYGLTGTTNLSAITETLRRDAGTSRGVVLLAVLLAVAGLGFRITAVPFHFYAPDVYQGTSSPVAAMLAFIPKVAGFVALCKLLGYLPPLSDSFLTALYREYDRQFVAETAPLGRQMSKLLWILAAVTMTLGNVLALLQDNVKRMLAYSSVAHAGYMLISLAVAPELMRSPDTTVGGVEAILFYLTAYGAMTIGAFAVLGSLSTPERPVETLDDVAGLGRTHSGKALLMTLFMFSLIGMPPTGGFVGKFQIFLGALSVPKDETMPDQPKLFIALAVVAALNAAIGGYYYLRVIAVMWLRDSLRPIRAPSGWPAMTALGLCAVLTFFGGFWLVPNQVREAVRPAAVAEKQPETRAQAP
jgi:NADH-quinone oxidoreductase subunit N